MSRAIKFRAWDDKGKCWYPAETIKDFFNYLSEKFTIIADWFNKDAISLEQYTGLKDKNGREIYENCELDGRYRVEYIAPKFVGKDMIKGDIIELYDNKFTITKEHCEISQNSERGIN